MPTSLEIGGVGYSIRSDYRDILNILCKWNDPNYDSSEKAEIMFRIFYPDWRSIPLEHYEEALKKAKEFIDMGMEQSQSNRKPTMDWEQDATIIIPAINKVIGKDVRGLQMHWWTFLSAYMEISGGVFSTVLTIRQKKQKHQKLEKYEQEFYKENRAMCDLKQHYTAEEEAERDKYRALLGIKG